MKKTRTKIRVIVLLLTMMFLTLFSVSVLGAEELQSDEQTIYALSEDMQEYISIPDTIPTSLQLPGKSWKIQSGNGLEIDSNGVAVIRQEIKYYHSSESGWTIITSKPSGAPDEYSKKEYCFGDTVVLVDGKQKITVHGVNYAEYYAEKVMKDYMDEHVKAGMSEYEIADLCCKFVAGFDYSPNASSYISMIARGGGDCWASTSTLLYMLKQQNITCASRDGSLDDGAGSMHVNVVAKLDGSYYILEAGINSPAPRPYFITQMQNSSIYTYRVVSESLHTAEITGLIINKEIVDCEIPEYIDGYTVIGIGNGAFECMKKLETVTMPNTITYLGKEAFYQAENLRTVKLSSQLERIGANCFTYDKSLETVEIPETVTEMVGNVFLFCSGLKSIQVNKNNSNFSSVDGVLFDKEQRTLLIFPAGKTGNIRGNSINVKNYLHSLKMDYRIPDGVECLDSYAFSGVDLKCVSFPSSIKRIRSYCFYSTYINQVHWPESLDTMESNVFRSSTIFQMELPSTLRTIESYAIYRGRVEQMIMSEGVESIGDYAFAGFGRTVIDLRLPASLKTVGAHALDLNYGWSSFDDSANGNKNTYYLNALFFAEGCMPEKIGEKAFGNQVLCVYPDSSMYDYAKSNQERYCLLNRSGRLELKSEWLKGVSSYYYSYGHYTGEPQDPWMDWNTSDGTCPFSIPEEAYIKEYENDDNINIGTHGITLKGSGLFTGTLKTSFRISRASSRADVVDRSGCGLQYSINNGEASIVGYLEKSIPSNLVIPSKLDGYPVTAIEYGALEGCSKLRSVTIPSTIKTIEREAFCDCENLMKVTIPKTVTKVDYLSFGFETPTKGSVGKPNYSGFVWKDGFKIYGNHKSSAESYAKTYGLNWNPLEHSKDSYLEIIPARKATYAKTGLTEGKKCKICSTIIVKQKTIAKKKVAPVTGLTWKAKSSTKCKVSWKVVSRVRGYEVMLSRSTSFKNRNYWKWIGANKNSKTLAGLKSGKNYYVRVRAWVIYKNKTYYSNWSIVKKIRL